MTEPGISAFFSYTHFDDGHNDGKLTLLRDRLAGEMRAQTGKEFPIFQDKSGIKVGQQWKKRIQTSLEETLFYIPILTPSFFASPACREELDLFLKREQTLGRDDLIIPIYYISCEQLNDKAVRDKDRQATILADRQYDDWRKLRSLSIDSSRVRAAVVRLTEQVLDALKRPAQAPVSPSKSTSRASSAKPSTVATKPAVVTTTLPKATSLPARAKPPAPKIATSRSISPKPKLPKTIETDVIDSGAWLLLGGHLFLTASFNEQDDKAILVEIESPSPEDEAALRDLGQPAHHRNNPLGYAYKNRASLVSLGPLKEKSVGGKSVFTLVLKPTSNPGNSMMDFTVTENNQTYSPDDIAQLRARLLLLNQPLPGNGQRGHSLISSGGYDAPIKITEAIFPASWRQHHIQPDLFRLWARLAAVYFLLLSGTCEHVLELRLGPVQRNGMRVVFRGRRRQYYTNQDAAVITADGVCLLA